MTRDRRGVALITALVLILFLGAIATKVMQSAYGVSDTADNVRSRAVGRYAAESGVVLAASRIEESLVSLSDSAAIKRYLNGLERTSASSSAQSLGDARFQMTIVDVNAKLDVNSATVAQLMTLFTSVGSIEDSKMAATAIRNRIEYGARDSIGDVSRPRPEKPLYTTPLRSLEELSDIPGVDPRLVEKAAPFLTVDGDGKINRLSASDRVLAAASGDLRDYPSRLLVISRGWKNGHPLTCEIQVVYALEYGRLTMVSWRERDL